MVSVDGYYAGTDGNISWHKTDSEFNDFAIAQLKEVGSLIFGRITYELMSNYWPTLNAKKDDPIVADAMNNLPKIVFSKTLENPSWNNSKLIKNLDTNTIHKLKMEAEKDLFIFGSGLLVQEFEKLKLIDEYRLIINPLTLGSGKKLFNEDLSLELLKTKVFKNGNVLLCYKKL